MTDSTPATAAFDWSDPQTRRRLTTALIEIIYAQSDGADVVDLALHTPSLTYQEVEVVKAYFHGSEQAGITSEPARSVRRD